MLAYLASIGSQDEVGGQQAAGALEDALATVDPPDDRAVEQAGVGARPQVALAHRADVYGVASATHRDPTRLGERCLTAEGYVRLVGDAAAQQAGDGALSTALQRAQNPDLSKFLVIAALLFIIGVAGVLTRRNIIVIFMSIELILNAANLNFIAFSRYLEDTGNVNAVAGQVFTVFVIVVAAAEAAIGLGIVIALYRNKETIWVDEIDILKW